MEFQDFTNNERALLMSGLKNYQTLLGQKPGMEESDDCKERVTLCWLCQHLWELLDGADRGEVLSQDYAVLMAAAVLSGCSHAYGKLLVGLCHVANV